jgi:NitT/TauT family transport system substrate-binding protein
MIRRLTVTLLIVVLAGAACSSGSSNSASNSSNATSSSAANAGSSPAASPSSSVAATPTSTVAADAGDAKPLTTPVDLKVGLLPNVSAGALYVAKAKGYFKDENLNVDIQPVAGTQQAQPLLAAGQLDVQLGGVSAAYFNGIANGLDVKLVAGWGEASPGAPSAAIVALKDGPVKTAADLKGKKVALNGGLTSTSAWFLYETLKQANLTVDDVDVQDLGVADGLAALQNGAVQAAISAGPLLTKAIADGSQIIVGDIDKVLADGSGGGVIFGSNVLKHKRQAGVAFIRALLKATRTDLQGDYRANPEVVNILATAMNVPPTTITGTGGPTLFDPAMKLHPAVYDEMQGFWIDQKILTYATPLTKDQLTDGRFLELATAP